MSRWQSSQSIALLLVAAAGVMAVSRTTERYSATAAVTTAGGAAASAAVTIDVTRKMSVTEADALTGAFKTGGAAALRTALTEVTPTGTITIGSRHASPDPHDHRASKRQGPVLTMATVRQGAFVVDDYSCELILLTRVTLLT